MQSKQIPSCRWKRSFPTKSIFLSIEFRYVWNHAERIFVMRRFCQIWAQLSCISVTWDNRSLGKLSFCSNMLDRSLFIRYSISVHRSFMVQLPAVLFIKPLQPHWSATQFTMQSDCMKLNLFTDSATEQCHFETCSRTARTIGDFRHSSRTLSIIRISLHRHLEIFSFTAELQHLLFANWAIFQSICCWEICDQKEVRNEKFHTQIRILSLAFSIWSAVQITHMKLDRGLPSLSSLNLCQHSCSRLRGLFKWRSGLLENIETTRRSSRTIRRIEHQLCHSFAKYHSVNSYVVC